MTDNNLIFKTMPGLNTRRRVADEEDDDQPRGGRGRSSETTSGWDAIEKRKKENEKREAEAKNRVNDFRLKDKETSVIQFLEPEPIIVDTHSVKIDGKWRTLICQKSGRNRSCAICDAGIKATWKAAFLVRDFRGEWDKDKGRFKYVDKNGNVILKRDNVGVEKLMLANNQFALTIKHASEKSSGIMNFLWEVSRTGSSAKDTSYAIQRYLDPEDDDRPAKADKSYKAKHTLEDAVRPYDDVYLKKLGFDGSYRGDDDDDDDRGSSRSPVSRGGRGRGRDDDDE